MEIVKCDNCQEPGIDWKYVVDLIVLAITLNECEKKSLDDPINDITLELNSLTNGDLRILFDCELQNKNLCQHCWSFEEIDYANIILNNIKNEFKNPSKEMSALIIAALDISCRIISRKKFKIENN